MSATTWELLAECEEWESTGGVEIKGKGKMETFFWRQPPGFCSSEATASFSPLPGGMVAAPSLGVTAVAPLGQPSEATDSIRIDQVTMAERSDSASPNNGQGGSNDGLRRSASPAVIGDEVPHSSGGMGFRSSSAGAGEGGNSGHSSRHSSQRTSLQRPHPLLPVMLSQARGAEYLALSIGMGEVASTSPGDGAPAPPSRFHSLRRRGSATELSFANNATILDSSLVSTQVEGGAGGLDESASWIDAPLSPGGAAAVAKGTSAADGPSAGSGGRGIGGEVQKPSNGAHQWLYASTGGGAAGGGASSGSSSRARSIAPIPPHAWTRGTSGAPASGHRATDMDVLSSMLSLHSERRAQRSLLTRCGGV